MQGQACLTVQRLSPRTGLLRKVGVHVDEQQLGTLGVGAQRTFTLATGEHAIYVTLGKDRSNTVAVTLRDGETVHLVVNGAFRWQAVLFGPLYRGQQVELTLQVAS